MTGQELENEIAKKARTDGQFAIAYALLQIADAHSKLAQDLCYGTVHRQGSLESLASQLIKLNDTLSGVGSTGSEIKEGLADLAEAIPEVLHVNLTGDRT